MARRGYVSPKLVLTADQIVELERMVKIGMIQDHIALVFGMGKDTLENRFRDQPGVREAYERGKAQAAVTVLGQLWGLIEDGHPAAIFFYCKTKLGWRETNNLEVSMSLSIEQAIKEASGVLVSAGTPDDGDSDADG